MPARRRRPSASLSAKTAELALAVPQVVAHRVLRMAQAGPHLSARDRKEFARMIAEKNSAFGESWNAMALQTLHSQRALSAALALTSVTAFAADYPAPKEGEWVAKDFRFHTGEVFPQLKLHYTTIGDPRGEPVVVLHGTAGSARSMLTPAFAICQFGRERRCALRSLETIARGQAPKRSAILIKLISNP